MMTLRQILREVETLSRDEQTQLLKALLDRVLETPPRVHEQKRSLRAFRGVGSRLYDGTDAQEQVNQMRREWDERP